MIFRLLFVDKYGTVSWPTGATGVADRTARDKARSRGRASRPSARASVLFPSSSSPPPLYPARATEFNAAGRVQVLTILLPAWTLVEDRRFVLARTASCRARLVAWLHKRRGRPGWWVNGRWRGCTSRRGFAVHETFDMARTCGGRPNIFAGQVIS